MSTHESERTIKVGGHSYTVVQHPPTEGYGIVLQLLAAVSDPLAATLGPAVQGVLDALGKTESLLDVDTGAIGAALDSIDWSVAGPALQRAIPHLSLPLVRQVLRYAWRDGKPLSDDGEFDLAYARNYTELFQAVFEVVRFNGFFPLLDTFATAAGKAKAAISTKKRDESRSTPPDAA